MSSSKKATPPPRATPQDPNSKPRRESKAQQPESKPSEPKSKSHSESRSQQPESMPRDQIPKPPKEARAQQQESKPPEPISRSQGEPNPPRVTIPTQAKCDEHNFARFHFSSSFTCSGCERESQGVRYRCTTCDNAFHDQCQTFKETKDDHRHTYKLRYHRKIFKCDGCKEEGFGKRFRCDQCGHELHTLCMFPEEPGKIWCTKLEFDFHREETNSGKICYACTKDIDGYYYHCANYKKIDDNTCTQDGMYLHPCCVKLKPTLIGVFGKAESNKDETLYNLTIDKEYQKNIKCFLCNHNQLRTPHRTDEHYRGWSYVRVCYKLPSLPCILCEEFGA